MASNKSLPPISKMEVPEWTHIWPLIDLQNNPWQPVLPIFSEHNIQSRLQAVRSQEVEHLDKCAATIRLHQRGYPLLSVLPGVPRRRRDEHRDPHLSQIHSSVLGWNTKLVGIHDPTRYPTRHWLFTKSTLDSTQIASGTRRFTWITKINGTSPIPKGGSSLHSNKWPRKSTLRFLRI